MKTLTILLTVALIAGCGTLPFSGLAKKEEKAAAKVKAVEHKSETNAVAQVRQGAGMTDAGLWALKRNPAPTAYDDVACMMLERSLLSFQNADMMPPASEILVLRKMVDSLLSSNAVLRSEGSNALARADARQAATERKEAALASQLEDYKSRWEKAASEAAKASTLFGFARRLGIWLLWGAGIMFILRIVAGVTAAAGPPWNLIGGVGFIVDGIVGGASKLLFGLLPKAKAAAGVVDAKLHELADGTAGRLVAAIDAFEKNDPAGFAKLAAFLRDKTDEDTHRRFIRQKRAA